ncbi:SDR family oxidoreductase [Nocardioides massiliensis]|uniref:NAD(P)-dependent dehydrogenase (Short-subunit alcohol dehydrogenase family) n=1 Tax=Nocardioides massiliensis TaxID=1325935 RepID=A0ABT9NKB2_9ACTN|nr:SDR family oxidoreductase [Nocardioides massiliensis]MDP9820664.1 NAD(P)-dependent dehydrogenase (short-subunit alcohol dehydrogenase family) [Nocardioides massiliensis]
MVSTSSTDEGRSTGVGRLQDKVVIVTGAAQGIGEAYAKAIAKEGAAVVVADLNTDSGERVAKEIEADGGRAVFVRTDVSDQASAEAAAAAAVESFGGIDGLVNNAAIYGDMQFDLLISVDWDYYRRFMSVNMDGALVMTRAVYTHMQKRGGGSIVNQSSTAAYLYSGFYGLAKVGVNGLTQQLAHEVGGMGIRVNAIAPGPTDTAATRTQAGDASKELVKNLAIKRMGQVDDMVGACLFLLSDEAAWVTAQILAVDGGQVFRP